MKSVAPVIYLRPAEAWNYHSKNQERLKKELVEIATNEETKTSVFMTDDGGTPYLYVYRNDKKIFQSKCTTIYTTEHNLSMIYDKYLTSPHVVIGGNAEDKDGDNHYDDDEFLLAEGDDNNVPMPDVDEEDDIPPYSDLDAMSDAEFEDMVNEREEAIYSAMSTLIAELTEDEGGALEFGGADYECICDVIDHIVEYLAIQCGFRIRRPMTIIDDESGLLVRTEYPYDEYDFSDEELHG